MRRRPLRSRDLPPAISGKHRNARPAAAIPAAVALAVALTAAAGACASAPAARESEPARTSALPASAAGAATTTPQQGGPIPAATDPGAWKRVLPRPELPADRPLRVAFLFAEGVEGAEAAAVRAVLHRAARRLDGPGIELLAVSPDGGEVTTAEGLRLAADRSFADAPAADVLVVPGGEAGSSAAATVDWLRRAAATARWTVGLSDGAFLLARAGLLDGLAATTAPGDYDRFAQQFPGVELRVNASFVHDGPALTSQGGARSVEVALYLVDHLFGEPAARAVGEELLVGWPVQSADEPPFVVVPRPSTHPDAPPAVAGDGSP